MEHSKIEEKLLLLIAQGEAVIATSARRDPLPGVLSVPEEHVNSQLFKEWALDALSTLNQAFGKESEHYQHAEKSTKSTWRASDARSLLSIIRSALTTHRFSPRDEAKTNCNTPLEEVERICERFHLVACQLRRRYNARATIDVADEYDVQNLLHALLKISFDDVREEEWTPSFAGAASRMDFLLKAERLVIETKMARKGLGAKDLGAELLIDIARYASHPDCKMLVCFVYDPEGRINNPRGVERDLSQEADGKRVRVYIRPR